MTMETDVIIVGGGLAGLTSAIHLSRNGFKVMVIEKNSFPKHKVCGEYLSREVLPYLQWLGVDLLAKDPAEINRLLVSTVSGKSIETDLDMGGIGISRYVLDQMLLRKALENGCSVLKDAVTDINWVNGGYEVSTETSGIRKSRFAIGAFGKRSMLDHHLNRTYLQKKSPWLAVKGHYQGSFPDGLIALHHFKGGYCGVSKIENDIINICYLTNYESFRKHKNVSAFEQAVLCKNPHLAHILESSRLLFDKPISIGQVSFASRKKVESDVLMVGDAAGLIHPFCGNGMAIAIHSAKLISELITKYMNGSTCLEDQIKKNYTALWNQAFSSRMRTGELWSSLLKNRLSASLVLNTLSRLPFMLPLIIKTTHGRELPIST